METPTVFISYSHDSEEHSARVLQLANQLRHRGIDAELDQYQTQPSQGWPRWCEEQLRPGNADFVLVICTRTYLERVEGKAQADGGRGVYWEGSAMYNCLYDAKGNERFLPVLFDDVPEDVIPVPLRGYSRYRIREFDLADGGYEDLYRTLTHQPPAEKPELGEPVDLGTRGATVAEATASGEALQLAGSLPAQDVKSQFAVVPRWTDELKTYGDGWAGREEELAALDQAWANGRTRVFSLYAEGGAGKTRVLVKWLNNVRDDGWRGAGGVFVHSFYSQGSDERRNASSEVFFEDALAYFGYQGEPITDANEKGRRLAELIAARRGLLVLDGLEPLQHPPAFSEGRLKDPAIERLLLSLSVATGGDAAPALCVVTSRQRIVELRSREGKVAVQRHLQRLDAAAGAELLRQLEVRGPERELRDAVADFHGHAYSLMLLGSYLRDATEDHEIRRHHEIPLLEEDQGRRSHARRMFRA